MNLILREIKSNIKSIIFWSLGISLLIFGVISKATRRIILRLLTKIVEIFLVCP